MTLLAIRLLLGGWLKSALAFARTVPPKVWYALAVIAAVLLLWHIHAGWTKRAHDAAYAAGVTDTKQAFADAQAKADAAARAHVVKTVAAQNTINTESSNALHQTNDAIDARAEHIRLQHDAAIARRGAGVASNPGAASTPPAGACEAPAQDGLAWSVAYPLMIQAAKNDAQLNAILDWEAKQDALDALEPVAP